MAGSDRQRAARAARAAGLRDSYPISPDASAARPAATDRERFRQVREHRPDHPLK